MGELHPKHFDPVILEPFRIALGSPLTGLVRIVSDPNSLHVLDRFPKLIGKPLRAKETHRIGEPVRTERQRIEDRFAQDDFVGRQALPVEQPPMRPRWIQVLESARRYPPTVKTHHVSSFIVERHHDAPVKMFVATLAPKAQLRKPVSQPFAFLPVLIRQSQSQRPIGKTQLEPVDEFIVVQASAGQIGARRRRFLESLMIVGGNLSHQRCVVGLRIQRTRQPRDGRYFQRSLMGSSPCHCEGNTVAVR